MARYRVIRANGGWVVTRNGQRHFSKVYPTKREALAAARRAADIGDSVQGQRLDGTWEPERTKGVRGPGGDRR